MDRLTLTEKRQVKERERYQLEGHKFAIELTAQKKAWRKTAMPGYVYYPMLTEINQILGRVNIVDQDGLTTTIALASDEWYPDYLHEGPRDERYIGPLRLGELLPDSDSRTADFVDAFAEFLLEEAESAEYSPVRRAPVLDLTHVKATLFAHSEQTAESTSS